MFDEYQDEKIFELTLIDVVQKNPLSYSLYVYANENGDVFTGGSNHPTIGYSRGKSKENIGSIFVMASACLTRVVQSFENDRFVYR